MQKIPDTTENPRGFGGTPDPEPEMDENGAIPATEEEQMDYDLLTVRARKLIFGPAKEKILKQLGSSETPAQAIGKAGSMVLKSLMASAKQAGREIDPNTALHAATEIASDINDLAKANNVFIYDSPEDEQKELDDAMLWGVKFYGDGMIAAGEITPDMQKMAQKATQEGLAEEYNKAPKPKQDKVGNAVKSAMQPGGGIVNGATGGGAY